MENWLAPQGQYLNKKVIISFKIFPKGSIDHPSIKESSGVEQLDSLALDAISNSAPFPKFKAPLKSSNLNISIHFKYTLAKNLPLKFLPEMKDNINPFVNMVPLNEVPLTKEKLLAREQRIESLAKSVENRGSAGKGLGYKDFYFGDSFDLIEGLIRKRCSPTKRAFMKGDFGGRFVSSIYTDESKTLDGWCYDKFVHFFFNYDEKLTRIIWEVSATPDNDGVIRTYQRLRKQLTSGNEYNLTKARSSNLLERVKGQRKTTLIDEFENGVLLLVLEIERIQTQIYAIYQDKNAAKNYTKIKDAYGF